MLTQLDIVEQLDVLQSRVKTGKVIIILPESKSVKSSYDNSKVQLARHKLQAFQLIQCFGYNPETQPVYAWVNLKQTIGNVIQQIQCVQQAIKIQVKAQDAPFLIFTNEQIFEYVIFTLCTFHLNYQLKSKVQIRIFNPTTSNDCTYLLIQFDNIPYMGGIDYYNLFNIKNFKANALQRCFFRWGGAIAIGLALQLCNMRVEKVSITQFTQIIVKIQLKEKRKYLASFNCKSSDNMDVIQEELSYDEINEEDVERTQDEFPKLCSLTNIYV